MAQQTERTVLNHLIETCTDAERGFRSAADLVKHPALKSLFIETAAQRAQFAADLLPHAHRLGGDAAADGTSVGSLHRHFMDIMSALTRHDDHRIVMETARGDAVTLHAYKDAIEGMLPPSVRDLVERQYAEVQAGRERIEGLDRVHQHAV